MVAIIKSVSGWGLAIIVSVGAMFFLGDHYIQPPSTARMIVDLERFTYASVPCVILGKTERELIRNRSDALDPGKDVRLQPYADESKMWMIEDLRHSGREKWRRDERCNSTGGFEQHETLWDRVFGQQSRWTADGEWRW